MAGKKSYDPCTLIRIKQIFKPFSWKKKNDWYNGKLINDSLSIPLISN